MARLPPSLKWLIVQRGSIDGKILKAERFLDKNRNFFEAYQKKIEEIVTLKETLASIDRTLFLHDIQVDPQHIPAIRRQEKNGICHSAN
jgi:hypothetical protein